MLEVVRPWRVRVARTHRIERAPGSACAMATKLYWPPTPLTTWPFSSASETAAPSSVTIIVAVDAAHVTALQDAQLLVRRRTAG